MPVRVRNWQALRAAMMNFIPSWTQLNRRLCSEINSDTESVIDQGIKDGRKKVWLGFVILGYNYFNSLKQRAIV